MEALEAAGIHYVHFKELGTPRPLRDAVKSDGDYARFFQAMREHLATREEAIERACGYVARMTCCLMCYEKAVDTCHRKIVAQIIQDHTSGELHVVHLQTN